MHPMKTASRFSPCGPHCARTVEGQEGGMCVEIEFVADHASGTDSQDVQSCPVLNLFGVAVFGPKV